MVTVDEYRKILKDYKSSDEQIIERVEYIVALAQNIIRDEIKAYATSSQNKERGQN